MKTIVGRGGADSAAVERCLIKLATMMAADGNNGFGSVMTGILPNG